MSRRFVAFLFGMLVALLQTRTAVAKDTDPAKDLVGIEIEDRHGAELNRSIEFTDAEGHTVHVGDYLDGKKPLVVVMAYFECPMLCSMVINSVLTEMKALRWSPGEDYRVLVVSFDPRDTVESAAAKQKNYRSAYGRPVGAHGFDFVVGDKAQVAELAQTLGFHYRWDEETKQFAHAAGAFIVTPDGRLSRTLYGLGFQDMRLALLEASEGKIGSVVERIVLFCYHYDPDAKGYTLATIRLVKAGGLLTLFGLGALLFSLWRGERKASELPAEQRA